MDVKLPKLGEGAESGVVVSILVSVGDTVEKDQTILELENEKAVAPIPSSGSGVVSKIHVNEGDTVSVGQVLISIGGEASNSDSSSKKEQASQVQTQTTSAVLNYQPQAFAPQLAPQGFAQNLGPVAAVVNSNPVTTPSIRKISKQIGLDLTRIIGSGSGGRIEMSDIQRHIQVLQNASFQAPQIVVQAAGSSTQPEKKAEPLDFSAFGTTRREKMTSLRNVISRRMREAWNDIPHVTQFDEADITPLMSLRKKFKDAYAAQGGQLTVTVFLIKAISEVLKEFPIFNSSIDEASGEIVYKEYFHVGVAVDTDSGLIVPVLRDCNQKSLLELSQDLKQLAQDTRDRKVPADRLKGGSITISNLGGIGGTHFTPIVNKPEVAILGVGKGVLKPWIVEGKIEPRMMLPLALSYDHRIIDGADAARFMSKLVALVEQASESEFKI